MKKNIALAMVSIDNVVMSAEFDVVTASMSAKATIVEYPFYDPRKQAAAT